MSASSGSLDSPSRDAPTSGAALVEYHESNLQSLPREPGAPSGTVAKYLCLYPGCGHKMLKKIVAEPPKIFLDCSISLPKRCFYAGVVQIYVSRNPLPLLRYPTKPSRPLSPFNLFITCDSSAFFSLRLLWESDASVWTM